MKKKVTEHKDGSISKEYKISGEELKKMGVDTSEIEAVSEKVVNNLEVAVEELTGDLQRTRADFENFRKQVEVQKMNERKAAKYATVMKMLPLLDDLDRAIASYKELKPLEKSLAKTLKELQLEKISSAEGIEFSPDFHDAVMVEGEGEKEVIAETLRPGYLYEGEVLRPAMVKVKRI